MKPIDIVPADLEIVRQTLQDFVPDIEVRAFGSRVEWMVRETSDIDLALMTDERLPTSQMANLREAFSESDLPFKVDLIDWAGTSDNFRKIIEREYVVVQTKDWQKHGSAKSVGLKLPPKDNQEHRSNRSDWISTTVGSFCPFLYGKGLPENKRNKNGNFKVYGSNGPVGTHDRPLVGGPGIVIGRKGTVGVIHFSPNSFWPIDTTFFVGDETERDLRFTYYLLKSIGLEHMNADSAVPGLNRDAAHAKRIQIPKYSEQQAIAHILGTLDDKIELNRQMNETLEAIARTLFKSWFVDFDPVRAKMEGRQPAGVSPKLAALFPDSFEDSELGAIPKGWEIGKLGDIAEHSRRGIQPNDINPDTPYIALKDMPRRCIALSEWGAVDDIKSNKHEFRRGEILFGKLRPYFHKVGIAPTDGICSTDIVVLTPVQEVWLGFVLCHVSSNEFIAYTDANSTGTKMPRTNWTDMSKYLLVVPPEPIIKLFNTQTSLKINRIITSVHESRTLSTLRDNLLPKLISGESRIENVKKSVELIS